MHGEGSFKELPPRSLMSRVLRVIIMDLLVERSEFGHGGNQEVIAPMAESGEVEVLLVTPQMQSEEVGNKAQKEGLVTLTRDDVPHWNNEFPFWERCEMEIFGNMVTFRRVAMPAKGDDELMGAWLDGIFPDAVICSGSKRNVSIWEDWMESGSSMLRCSTKLGIPTLGICFGHQLLCHSLGSKVERADTFSSGVWDLDLTENGMDDILFSSRMSGKDGSPVVLYSHQDHVTSVPDSCILLATAEHNRVTAIRAIGEDGGRLLTWGVQFHPEAAKARVERAFEWGHISKEEMDSFQRDHDGAGILSSFASVVINNAL